MICENAYYPDGNENEKPNCSCEMKLKEDDFFNEKCPLIYYCTINERFEQTIEMFGCKYREGNK